MLLAPNAVAGASELLEVNELMYPDLIIVLPHPLQELADDIIGLLLLYMAILVHRWVALSLEPPGVYVYTSLPERNRFLGSEAIGSSASPSSCDLLAGMDAG